ncbi:MAG: aminotransferase class I/II-fold pyridoxal phosphate-dependent enzyme, partial [Woeseiaceae bacterium]|nr:aminotransferase class I/II-fold pyridoxal phosphate-dependent enzyme [Woeseiaceae bacterium]
MSIVKLARPEIQALHAYEAAAQVDDTIRLNANESPRRSPVGSFRRPLNRYPEVRPQQLQRALAERFGCAFDELLVTRGSSEAIDLVIRTFCRARIDSVLVTSPSFSMYRHYAEVQGANLIEVKTRPEQDFAVDIDAILEACDDSTRLIFICSPNNPTGTTLARDELERLLRARGGASAIVVDEAYVEFGSNDSVTGLLSQYDNLLVLRTLSKALGFAGARCGAVAGPAAVVRMLGAVQAPYALATPVVECVEDA